MHEWGQRACPRVPLSHRPARGRSGPGRGPGPCPVGGRAGGPPFGPCPAGHGRHGRSAGAAPRASRGPRMPMPLPRRTLRPLVRVRCLLRACF
ncbi:hypothetical protein SGM_0967 [Streptomyces griseoaurantiacus M045]|uniref:Uncharacterized protein n=1 Tax=Streptomyces griseoaurantiacus M045 TaxID=996637 RepID=F3NCV3_9ACTN|nr:hypothetical protein SGM_0967 [Streptomyces griseoaurantiacus M045]